MHRRKLLKMQASAAAGILSAPVVTAQQGKESIRIRVGQIGTNHAHASGKMSTLRKLSDHFEVIGVVEPDDDQWEKVKTHRAYAGLNRITEGQLLATPGLSAVAVETEIDDLVPTALRCVKAGLHVHLDKPAGASLDELKMLHRAADAADRTIQMGYMLRYNAGIQFCRKAIADGWLGEVFEVHAVMSKTIGHSDRKPLAAYAGGAMFELGCHLIDSVVAMLGKPEKVTPFLRRSRSDDALADNCLAVLEYPQATATVRTALMEVSGQARRQLTVCGNKGTVDIRPLEPPKLRLALDQKQSAFEKGYQDVLLPSSTGRYDGEFLDLAAIIRGEKKSDFSLAHDLAVHETILRASEML